MLIAPDPEPKPSNVVVPLCLCVCVCVCAPVCVFHSFCYSPTFGMERAPLSINGALSRGNHATLQKEHDVLWPQQPQQQKQQASTVKDSWGCVEFGPWMAYVDFEGFGLRH